MIPRNLPNRCPTARGCVGRVPPATCPIVEAVDRFRIRAGELGITSPGNVLMYIAERLESCALKTEVIEDNLDGIYRAAAAQCVAIAKMEG